MSAGALFINHDVQVYLTAGGLGSGGGGCGRGFPIGGRLNDFRGVQRLHGALFTGGQQAVRIGTHDLLDLVRDLRVLFQEDLGVIAALAQADIAVVEPGAALLHNAQLDAQVQNLTDFRDALAEHDVKLGLTERGCHFVLDDLGAGTVADKGTAGVLQALNAAHINTYRGIIFQGAAAGGHFRVAVHHTDFFAQLVNKDADGVCFADDAGQLTEKVRRKPYSVILLDEIEKAHPEVFNLFLQILDDGRVADSHGKIVNFENTIIIMTTNAGSEFKSAAAGFNSNDEVKLDDNVDKSLKQFFKPEFLNRIDEIVTFKPLTKENLRQIIDLLLKDIHAKLAEKDAKLVVTDEAKELILEKGYDKRYGARPLKRAIQKLLEDKLSILSLTGQITSGCVITADRKDNEITLTAVSNLLEN